VPVWLSDCLSVCLWFCCVLLMQPGYLRPLLPAAPPSKPEPWSDIKKDFWEKIMKGAAADSRMSQRLCGHPHMLPAFCTCWDPLVACIPSVLREGSFLVKDGDGQL
jgi:hypothetical protein